MMGDTETATEDETLCFFRSFLPALRLYRLTLRVYVDPCGSLKQKLAGHCLVEKGFTKSAITPEAVELLINVAAANPNHNVTPTMNESHKTLYEKVFTAFNLAMNANEKGP